MDVWDVRWDNTIAAKVNDYLNVNLTFLLVYEEAQIAKNTDKRRFAIGSRLFDSVNDFSLDRNYQ